MPSPAGCVVGAASPVAMSELLTARGVWAIVSLVRIIWLCVSLGRSLDCPYGVVSCADCIVSVDEGIGTSSASKGCVIESAWAFPGPIGYTLSRAVFHQLLLCRCASVV